LEIRGNWRYYNYDDLVANPGKKHMELVYSQNGEINRHSEISGNMYNSVKILGNKNLLIKTLLESNEIDGSKFMPLTIFIKKIELEKNSSEQALRKYIESIYVRPKTVYYLKSALGSNSSTVFIVKSIDEIVNTIKTNRDSGIEKFNSDWILSENVDSYLFKRKGKYSPDGIVHNEKIGHKGQFKFFVVLKNDSHTREAYLYNKACYTLAPYEFTGDYSAKGQNFVTGLGERSNLREFVNVPEEYDIDSDFGFTGEQIFGNEYFTKIIPQFIEITQDIFKVTHDFLNCKNDFYYTKSFKSCFQLLSFDIIVDSNLKCYFLEMNTRPDMIYKKYDSLLDFDGMVEGIIRICIDPYINPLHKNKIIEEDHWSLVSSTHRDTHFKTFYVRETWRLSKQMKTLFHMRSNWQEIIYPNKVLDKYKIDFIGKRSIKNNEDGLLVRDPLFENGILISKISTLNDFLGNKKVMYDILSNDPRSFEFLPLTATFNVKDNNWEKLIEFAMNYSKSIKTWILKPAVGLQGKDIIVSNNEKEVINYIRSHSEYSDWVLSQYIDNPFLLKLSGKAVSGNVFNDTIGRKNHIRIYVLITKINSETHIYLYDNNLIFCAVKEYSDNFKDEYSNLTNLHLGSLYYDNVLGLNGKDAYRDLSHPVENVLNEVFGPDFYHRVVLPQLVNMLEVVLDNSVEYLKCVNYSNKKSHGCFQYIAFDVMPDSNFKLYLLEINARPGMNAPMYHWKGLKNFANSLLNKTSDVIFKNKKTPLSRKGFILIK